MNLLDSNTANTLITMAQNILKEHFFYDNESLKTFCLDFAKEINSSLSVLKITAPEDFKIMILGSKTAKIHFTAQFISFHICHTLFETLNFNELEIDQFENILIKYIRACEPC